MYALGTECPSWSNTPVIISEDVASCEKELEQQTVVFGVLPNLDATTSRWERLYVAESAENGHEISKPPKATRASDFGNTH